MIISLGDLLFIGLYLPTEKGKQEYRIDFCVLSPNINIDNITILNYCYYTHRKCYLYKGLCFNH